MDTTPGKDVASGEAAPLSSEELKSDAEVTGYDQDEIGADHDSDTHLPASELEMLKGRKDEDEGGNAGGAPFTTLPPD